MLLAQTPSAIAEDRPRRLARGTGRGEGAERRPRRRLRRRRGRRGRRRGAGGSEAPGKKGGDVKVAKEDPCLFLGYFAPGRAVMVERPWKDVLKNIPEPMYRTGSGRDVRSGLCFSLARKKRSDRAKPTRGERRVLRRPRCPSETHAAIAPRVITWSRPVSSVTRLFARSAPRAPWRHPPFPRAAFSGVDAEEHLRSPGRYGRSSTWPRSAPPPSPPRFGGPTSAGPARAVAWLDELRDSDSPSARTDGGFLLLLGFEDDELGPLRLLLGHLLRLDRPGVLVAEREVRDGDVLEDDVEVLGTVAQRRAHRPGHLLAPRQELIRVGCATVALSTSFPIEGKTRSA